MTQAAISGAQCEAWTPRAYSAPGRCEKRHGVAPVTVAGKRRRLCAHHAAAAARGAEIRFFA